MTPHSNLLFARLARWLRPWSGLWPCPRFAYQPMQCPSLPLTKKAYALSWKFGGLSEARGQG